MSNLLEKAKQQPDKAPRSILDPHYEVIATLRKKHWTFREIADFFKKKGTEVSVTWLTQYWTIKNGPSKKSSSSKKNSGSKKDAAYKWYLLKKLPTSILDLDTENKTKGSLVHFFPEISKKVSIHEGRGLDVLIDHIEQYLIVFADMGASIGQVTHE